MLYTINANAFDKVKKAFNRYAKKAAKVGLECYLNIINEYPKEIELRLEKDFLGIYLTDNPLYKYAYTIQTKSNFSMSDIEYDIDEGTGAIMMPNENVHDNQRIRFVSILNSVAQITTKKKTLMARLELEDLTGIGSALVWPDTYSSLKDKLTENRIYMCYGTLKISSDEPPIIIIDDIDELEDLVIERAVIKVNTKEEAVAIVNTIASEKMAKGTMPLYLEYGNVKVLLTKQYWININFMSKKFKDIEIEVF